MPIDHCIDHSRRLVIARGRGIFTDSEVFAYQREVWSRPDVAGYDELVDMSEVETIIVPTPAAHALLRLATESAAMEPPAITTKFAIVAPEQHAYGLGRMYQTFRELDPHSTKQVRVFRTLHDALSFLGIESLDELPFTGR